MQAIEPANLCSDPLPRECFAIAGMVDLSDVKHTLCQLGGCEEWSEEKIGHRKVHTHGNTQGRSRLWTDIDKEWDIGGKTLLQCMGCLSFQWVRKIIGAASCP